MRFLHFGLAAGIAVGLLAGCHSDKKPVGNAAEPAAPAATTPALPAAPANSPGAYYRQYRGLLPGAADSITLHLLATPRQNNNTEIIGLFASYHRSDGHPYQLLNHPSTSPDSVVLADISPEIPASQSPAPNWRLLRQGRYLTGTCNGQPIRLREAQPPGSLAFAVRCYADSIVAFPGVAKSPAAHLSLQTVVPRVAVPALSATILRSLRGDTLPGKPAPQLPQLWAQRLATYQKDYREDAEAARGNLREPSDEMPFGYGLRYEDQQATYVLWNQAPLLSLGFFGYSYTGGAHGSYGTQAATYDTRTGQQLRFADIFRPGIEAQLSTVLNQAVRRTLRIPAAQPLDEILFVKTMPVTHNLYLTSGGAVFIYTPYEIASYAQGEIAVFVPMVDLQPLLKPQLAS